MQRVFRAKRTNLHEKYDYPALESGPPSGRVSVEHVVNVLARLNAAPLPQTAATQLKVSIPPLADTARYDSLRADAAAATQEADHA